MDPKDPYNCYCDPPDACKAESRKWCILGGATNYELQEEVLKQMAERKAWQEASKKWEKADYRMKKDQLFRRFQVEKEERMLQQCLCKAEYDKAKRERQIGEEEKFAEAIKDLKEDEIRESAFRKQLYTCSPEIRELERELRRAYYAKTLYAQRLEGEAKKLEEKMRQQELYEMLKEKLDKFDHDEQMKEIAEDKKKKDFNKALRNQLEDATSKAAKKEEEFQKDKAMIDEIVGTIEKEEIQDLIEKNNKIQLFRSEIKHFLDSREFHRGREKARNKLEDQKIAEFMKNKEEQQAAYNALKAERDAAKASIVAKAIDRIMQAQFKNEEMEELRRELYEEEIAETVRRKDAEELEKKHRQMIELREAEAEAKQIRAEKLAAEKVEEEEFRKQLIEKFAEDERLEQMGNQKRRQREIAHRKKVEEMILERRALKAQLRERQLEARNCFDEESQRRKDLVEKERHKLLREHGPKLLGFIPRGVIQSQAELEKLGEPFLSYYRNQPRAPDPSTIDFSPCEEEIFKNMQLPRNAKV